MHGRVAEFIPHKPTACCDTEPPAVVTLVQYVTQCFVWANVWYIQINTYANLVYFQAALDSWVWLNSTSAAPQCVSENTGSLPPKFFSGGWLNYTGGSQGLCNTTANLATIPANETRNWTAPATDATSSAGVSSNQVVFAGVPLA